jgi:ABC-type lipoprotein release transport system permease subunit
MNHAQVFRLVVMETLMLTLVGVPVGMAVSWLGLDYSSKAGIDISSISGAAMSGFGFESIIYPRFPKAQVGSVVTIVFVTALLSSVFPSLKAMRLQPADALRQ